LDQEEVMALETFAKFEEKLEVKQKRVDPP